MIFIKHYRNTDIAFAILKSYKFKHKIKLKGYWINIVNPNNEYIIYDDVIEIEPDRFKEWEVYCNNAVAL